MKKLLALVIALVMVLAATSAFADGLLKIGYVQQRPRSAAGQGS